MATDHLLYADEHKSPQPEKWAKDGTKVDQLLKRHASSSPKR
jgi:hypothetical protein